MKMKHNFFFILAYTSLVDAWTTNLSHVRKRSTSATSLLGSRRKQQTGSISVVGMLHGLREGPVLNRRLLLDELALIGLGLTLPASFPNIQVAAASEVRAPLELLCPATRVRLYIDQAITLCQTKGDPYNSNNSRENLERIGKFFEREPIFITEEEERLSQRYLQIDTSSAWQAARLKELEEKGAENGIDYTTPYDKLNTAIQQWGAKRQFQILRQRQRRLERSNAMRAAFNAYTNNLVFGDTYQLNVEGAAKKAMVRNDALPNVNSVVVSDLDLRDLYRNQVLQKMDDAKAELQYQLKSGDVEIDEILSYLIQAKESCDEWFSFIPKADVEEAIELVKGASGSDP